MRLHETHQWRSNQLEQKINENQKFRKVVPNTTDAMSGVEKPTCKFVAKSKFKRKKFTEFYRISSCQHRCTD